MGSERAGRCGAAMTNIIADRSTIRTASGARKRSRIDWIKPFTDGQGDQLRRGRFRNPLVRRRDAQPQRQLPRPASRRAGRHDRDHLGARRSRRAASHHHLSRTSPRRVPLCQCAEGQWRRARRPGDDLSADGARSGGGDARLRADRGGAFGGVRRLLARGAGGANPGLRFATRWLPPTRGCAAASTFRSRPMSMPRWSNARRSVG